MLPFSVAFASGLHAGPLTHPGICGAIVDVVNDFEADILLLGGDYVSLRNKYVDSFAQRVARIRPGFGIFGVFGNHDIWLDDKRIKARLELRREVRWVCCSIAVASDKRHSNLIKAFPGAPFALVS